MFSNSIRNYELYRNMIVSYMAEDHFMVPEGLNDETLGEALLDYFEDRPKTLDYIVGLILTGQSSTNDYYFIKDDEVFISDNFETALKNLMETKAEYIPNSTIKIALDRIKNVFKL